MRTTQEDVMQEVMKILILHSARESLINTLIDYHDEWAREAAHWGGEFVNVRGTAELFICNWAESTFVEVQKLKQRHGKAYTLLQFWRYSKDVKDAQDLKRICRRLYAAGSKYSAQAFSGCC
jgi:hypothetical protein